MRNMVIRMIDENGKIDIQNIFNDEDVLSINDSDIVIENQSEVQDEDKNK